MAILGQGVHLDGPVRIARFSGDQELCSRAWEIEPWLVGVLQFNPGISTKVMGKIKARAEDGAGQVVVMIGALAAEGEVGSSLQLITGGQARRSDRVAFSGLAGS